MLFVVHETEGVPDGYAVYRVKDDWGATGPRAKVGVQELLAVAPDARARLWRHVTDADLTVRCEYWNAPVDDPFFPVHDRLAAEEFVNVGGGGTWVINERVSAYALYMHSIEGTNGHKLDHRVSIGLSYGIGPR